LVCYQLAKTYQTVRSEVVYGQNNDSRIDFLLTGGERLIYLEVKNTTWSIDDVAIFPDTETTRGQKHLRELIDVMPEAGAVMLYLINRGDLTKFAPGDTTDPFTVGYCVPQSPRGCKFFPVDLMLVLKELSI
jgi:sugar fermentation stimulation protein A